ncbi:hypothetical protein MKQ70_32190 [Chitinophaga sedimenti]|uniref:hypothetical protein n=1 Tax=Chitinophaga sedimenti TaxID=2033606 RepID=UPI0020065215|nr:hypothetical protein [Chitinophaga sedimenti]MCK7559378.1 hypothetical protein [Chitinophaga sedimenti]
MTELPETKSGLKIIISLDAVLANEWVLYELYDARMTKVYQGWSDENTYYFNGVEPAIYVIKVSNSRGVSFEKAVEVVGEKTSTVVFRRDNSALIREIRNSVIAYSRASDSPEPTLKGGSILDKALGQFGRLQFNHIFWSFNRGTWEVLPRLEFKYTSKKDYRWQANMKLKDGVYGIEYDGVGVSGEKVRKFTFIPPGEVTISVLDYIRYHKEPLIIGTNNDVADTLGNLLHSQDIDNALGFLPVYQSINLMSEKRKDHAAAAIGGYYLVKTGHFEMLYTDWAENLANWFPKMSDGPIILAWKLIREHESPNEAVIREFRSLLLRATERGVPYFTEGLKLLYEGLSQIWRGGRSGDLIVEEARLKVGDFMDKVDKKAFYTTFNNYVPIAQTGKWKVYVYPEDRNSLAEMPDLVPQT